MCNCLCLTGLPTCPPLRQRFPNAIVNAPFSSPTSNVALTVLFDVPARLQPSLQLIPSNSLFRARCPQWLIRKLGDSWEHKSSRHLTTFPSPDWVSLYCQQPQRSLLFASKWHFLLSQRALHRLSLSFMWIKHQSRDAVKIPVATQHLLLLWPHFSLLFHYLIR